jgi:hypothetical protein
MALYHDATITPTKAEMIERWLPNQPWSPKPANSLEIVGAYRFDDPEGQVGMETHLVESAGTLLQVPLTYRGAPLEGGDDSLIGEMEHSALGTRWVYDGLGDPSYLIMLAAVSMTGQGQAVGMVVYDGRWFVAPSNVRLRGGGWSQQRVPVDGFERLSGGDDAAVFRNDGFELIVYRRPLQGSQPPIGLTATWSDIVGSVVLTEVRRRS